MVHLLIDKTQIPGQDAREVPMSQGLMAMLWRLLYILALIIAGPVLAKDQVSPKKGAIPNGLFASAGQDQFDFAIVSCRQTYDVLKCLIQMVEAKKDGNGQCQISMRQMREDIPWQTSPLDSGKNGHWAVLRERPASRCQIERRISFSRSKEGGRMDLMRFTRSVGGAKDDAFCQKIPEVNETWYHDPSIVKTPDCQSFTLKRQ